MICFAPQFRPPQSKTLEKILDAIEKAYGINQGLVYNHPTMGKVKFLTDADTPPGVVKSFSKADIDAMTKAMDAVGWCRCGAGLVDKRCPECGNVYP